MKIEERNKKFYTEHGLKSLRQRLKSWIDLFNNKEFPFESQMFGFGKFRIENKEELKNRIKELSELIGENVSYKIEETKMKNGKSIKKEEIKWQ